MVEAIVALLSCIVVGALAIIVIVKLAKIIATFLEWLAS